MGCFVFKSKKKKFLRSDHYFCDGIKNTSSQIRHEIFQMLWEDLYSDIQILQSDLNTKIFDDLLQYTIKAHKDFTLDHNKQRVRVLQEIPTAALITGVNMPDHDVMFSNLVSLIKERVSPYVAVLKAKECNNMKNIMSKTVTQLMSIKDLEDDEDDQVTAKHSNTMAVLASWYADKVQGPGSPKKKCMQNGEPVDVPHFSPLVIVLEDLEAFAPNVLQDFLITCSNHLKDLPIILILGIATAVTALHKLLPHSVSSLLCIEKFQAPPSTEYLTQVINTVVITANHRFKLGARVFQFLLDIFLYHDFSVLNYIRGLQFAMMDHFYSNSLSALCCTLPEVEDQLKSMRHEELEHIRQYPSFRKYVECRPKKEQTALLLDDSYFKKVVVDLIEILHEYQRNYYPILGCLHIFVKNLPGHPLGKQIRELYAMNLSGNITETDLFKEAFTLLRTLSRDEILKLLQQCIERLGEYDVPMDLDCITEKFKQLADKFKNIEDLKQTVEDADDEPSELLPKKTDMHTLKKTLLEKKRKKLTVYESIRSETIDYLDDLCRKYLTCPKDLALNEIFYYDNVGELKRHLNGSPRAAIQTALSNPYYYLQNTSLKGDPGSISSSEPDVCIVYKLHLECGRLINLYDWLQAFTTVVQSGDGEEEDEDETKKQPSKELQARFIHAVSELQFLGFIKPTKRKTDHVARLTWGGC